MGIVVVVKVTVTIISACSLWGVGPTITTTIIIIRSHVGLVVVSDSGLAVQQQ